MTENHVRFHSCWENLNLWRVDFPKCSVEDPVIISCKASLSSAGRWGFTTRFMYDAVVTRCQVPACDISWLFFGVFKGWNPKWPQLGSKWLISLYGIAGRPIFSTQKNISRWPQVWLAVFPCRLGWAATGWWQLWCEVPRPIARGEEGLADWGEFAFSASGLFSHQPFRHVQTSSVRCSP